MSERRPKGTGTIRKRGDRWQGSFFLIDPVTGNRRQVCKTFDRKTEAQAWITAKQSEIRLNGATTGELVTVGDLLRLWLQSRDVLDLAPKTQSWYRGAVVDHLIPGLGDVKLDRLTAAQLDAFLTSKRSSGRMDGRPGGLSHRRSIGSTRP